MTDQLIILIRWVLVSCFCGSLLEREWWIREGEGIENHELAEGTSNGGFSASAKSSLLYHLDTALTDKGNYKHRAIHDDRRAIQSRGLFLEDHA